jgi:hypothetical protein
LSSVGQENRSLEKKEQPWYLEQKQRYDGEWDRKVVCWGTATLLAVAVTEIRNRVR